MEMKLADGFMNAVFTDDNGKEFRLKKGIPLNASDPVENVILEAAKANEDFTITLQATVHVVIPAEDREVPVLTPVKATKAKTTK